jgi:hypothetical protein
MITYDFITPGDGYTFKAKTPAVALITNLFVSEWKASVRPIGEDSAKGFPIYIFGCTEQAMEDEIKAATGGTLAEWLANPENLDDLAEAMDSFLIGGAGDRADYELACTLVASPEAQKAFKLKTHDRKRGSMNDWGTYAWNMAEATREKARALRAGTPE